MKMPRNGQFVLSRFTRQEQDESKIDVSKIIQARRRRRRRRKEEEGTLGEGKLIVRQQAEIREQRR